MPASMVSGPSLCVSHAWGHNHPGCGHSINRRNERLCWSLAYCWHLGFHASSSPPMALSGLRPTQAGKEAPKQQWEEKQAAKVTNLLKGQAVQCSPTNQFCEQLLTSTLRMPQAAHGQRVRLHRAHKKASLWMSSSLRVLV